MRSVLFLEAQGIHDGMSGLVDLVVALSILQFTDDDDALLVHRRNEIFVLSAEHGLEALYRIVILFLAQLQDHDDPSHVGLDVKLLRPVVDIDKEKIVKQQILDKAVLIKTLFVSDDQVLDLESGELPDHEAVFIVTAYCKDIFELVVIVDLEIMNSLDHLTVRCRIYKSLNIQRFDCEFRECGSKNLAVRVDHAELDPRNFFQTFQCIFEHLIRNHNFRSFPSRQIH